MGFGNVAAQIIFFVAVIMIAATVVILANDQLQENAQAYKSQSERLSEELRSDITITSLYYNDTSNELTVYVQNTGKTKMQVNLTDLYVNSLRIPYADRTVTIEADTDVGSSLIWDPSEIIRIQSTQNLDNSIHTIRIVSSLGAADQDTVSP